MVLRLDLEDGRQSAADVDGARVLARSLQHPPPRRRQLLQVDPRALVAAVLGPHDGEDAELGLGRLPLQERDDAIVFLLGDGHSLVRLMKKNPSTRSSTPVTAKTLAPSFSVPSA